MSPGDIAGSLAAAFDATRLVPLEKAVAEVLRQAGYRSIQADLEASKAVHAVLAALRRMPPQQLPFDISESRPVHLVGKRRIRSSDTDEARAARERFDSIPLVRTSIFALGDVVFERLCTRIMLAEGASEAVWNGAPDDGGIDFYGRLPVRSQSTEVPSSLMRTAVITAQLLFLGQCKCYDPEGGNLDRKMVDDFHGSIEICLSQYNGNTSPPAHRVPESYYRRDELALGVLCTTAGFSVKARSAADALGIQLVDGQQIAEFLIACGVANEANNLDDLASAIATWATGRPDST